MGVSSQVRSVVRRVAPVVLAATALVPTGAVRAQDAPATPPPTKLRPGLHLAADTKYAFEYSEVVATKSDATGPRSSSTHQESTATWNVTLELVEQRDDGTTVVSVVLDRLRGDYASESMSGTSYDSASGALRSGPGSAVGKAAQLEVSKSGVVTKAVDGAVAAAADGDSAKALQVFQWLFPPLPEAELARGKKVVVEREFAPNLVVSGIHMSGRIEETHTIKEVAEGVAEIKIAAKGSAKPEKSKDETVGTTPSRWNVSGDARVDLATGLYVSYTTKAAVETYTRIGVSKPPIELHGTHDVTRSLRAVAVPEEK